MAFELLKSLLLPELPPLLDLEPVKPEPRGYGPGALVPYRATMPTDIDFKQPSLKPFNDAIGVGAETFSFDEALQTYGLDSTNIKNAFTLSQGVIPDDLFNWYSQQSFIGYQAMAMVSQHWLVNKALRIPALDAIRNGFEIGTIDGSELDPDVLARIKLLNEKFKLDKNLVEFEINKRRFGFRFAIFNVESDDEEYYTKPFNIDGVTKNSYTGMTQVDPSWIAPILGPQAAANPSSMDFYEPTYWMVAGRLYHKSHLALVRYVELPDILKPTYQYGGISLTQLILERVYAAERTANEAPLLVQTKRLRTIHVELEKVAANPLGFEERIQQLISFQNNYGVFVAGIEDEMEQLDTSLSDLDSVIGSQYDLVAAVSEIPATKLRGTSPSGMNATGEYEQKNYQDLLENIHVDMDVLLKKHLQIMMQSEFFGEKIEVIPIWNPVSSPTPEELASINLSKAQTDNALMMTGAIDAEDIRNRIIEDKNSGYNGLEVYETEEDGDDGDGFGAIDLPVTGGGGGGLDPDTIQEASLNGLQISSLMEIVQKVATGEMEKSTAKAIILIAFPIDEAAADTLLQSVVPGSQEPAPMPGAPAGEEPENGVAEDARDTLGYVSVSPDDAFALRLIVWAQKAGLMNTERPDALHITLAHDANGISSEYVPKTRDYAIHISGVGVLGEGEKEALVLFLDSPPLHIRHEELKELGAEWSYDEFRPHMTIKYRPAPGDFERLEANMTEIPSFDFVAGDELCRLA